MTIETAEFYIEGLSPLGVASVLEEVEERVLRPVQGGFDSTGEGSVQEHQASCDRGF